MASADITLLNQTQSPLLRLPGEIRNKIYEIVFATTYIIVDHSRGGKPYTLLKGTGQVSCAGLLTLRQISRQIRFETRLWPVQFHKVRGDNLAKDVGDMSLEVRGNIANLYIEEMVHDLPRWRILALLPKVKSVIIVAPFVTVSPARIELIRQIVRRATGRKLKFAMLDWSTGPDNRQWIIS